MKKLKVITILIGVFLGFSLTSSAQNKVRFGPGDLHEIYFSGKASLAGEFSISDGFGGYSFQFDSNGTYKRRDFSCMEHYVSDSGVYRVSKTGHLELASPNQARQFILYRFDSYFFLIQPEKDLLFKQRLNFYADRFFHTKNHVVSGQRYTDQFFIAFALLKDYLTKLE